MSRRLDGGSGDAAACQATGTQTEAPAPPATEQGGAT
jgi:hypothetical protein